MNSNGKEYLDIDELARRIEERIKTLESRQPEEVEVKEEKKENIVDEKTDKKLKDLDLIIEEIDKKIKELDEDSISDFDVDLLMDKINDKLSRDEEEANNVIYDLDEITKAINETIKALEEKRKKKKAQKAKYCDLARKKAYEAKKDNKKSSS